MFQETTKPLLRPAQVQDWREQAKTLRELLSAPPHIANRIEDRGQLTKNLRSLEKDLQAQEPRPYAPEELDAAVNRSDQLKAEILEGMPTREEMRRNPAGAVDKHRGWEKRNKSKLNEWKNIQLRRHQTGDAELPDATDIANFEKFRPTGGSQQLNMHNEQISGRVQFGPEPGAGPAVVFSDVEVEFLKTSNPTVHARLPLLSNGERQIVKDFIGGLQSVEAGPSVDFGSVDFGDPAIFKEVEKRGMVIEPVKYENPAVGEDIVMKKPEKRRRNLTPEQRKAASDRMKARWAAKKQEG